MNTSEESYHLRQLARVYKFTVALPFELQYFKESGHLMFFADFLICIVVSKGRKVPLSQPSEPDVLASNIFSLHNTRSVARRTSATGRSCSLRADAAPRGVELGRGWFANFNSRVKASQLTGWERNVTLYQFCQFVKNVHCFPCRDRYM
jgi:hypothetical protein